jgi:peroxiredoxin
MTKNLYELPTDLPVPVDDGACDHLPGSAMPSVKLQSTTGGLVDVGEISRAGRTVFFFYPRSGRPDEPPIPGWDDIPGARGCTPQSCAFRGHFGEFAALGVRVFGVSAQDTEYQQEFAVRTHLPYPLLSDEQFALTNALRLPTFEAARMRLIKRLTLVVSDGRIVRVFYPVFPPDKNAEGVLAYLRTTASKEYIAPQS